MKNLNAKIPTAAVLLAAALGLGAQTPGAAPAAPAPKASKASKTIDKAADPAKADKAERVGFPEGKAPLAVRKMLVEKFGAQSGYVMGLYPGTVENFNATTLLDRYLPLVNEMSSKSESLVSFVPEPNVKNFKAKIANNKYPFVYVNAEIGATATAAGYIPLVKRSSPIISVILVLATSKLDKLEDFNGKKVGTVDQAMVTSLAKSVILTKGATPILENSGSSGQDELIRAIDAGQVEGIVLREEVAKSMQAKNPGKYKIAVQTGVAPGFILMALPSLPEKVKEGARQALLNLRAGEASSDIIMKGLDGKVGTTTFEPATQKELDDLVVVFKQAELYNKNRQAAEAGPAKPAPTIK